MRKSRHPLKAKQMATRAQNIRLAQRIETLAARNVASWPGKVAPIKVDGESKDAARERHFRAHPENRSADTKILLVINSDDSYHHRGPQARGPGSQETRRHPQNREGGAPIRLAELDASAYDLCSMTPGRAIWLEIRASPGTPWAPGGGAAMISGPSMPFCSETIIAPSRRTDFKDFTRRASWQR